MEYGYLNAIRRRANILIVSLSLLSHKFLGNQVDYFGSGREDAKGMHPAATNDNIGSSGRLSKALRAARCAVFRQRILRCCLAEDFTIRPSQKYSAHVRLPAVYRLGDHAMTHDAGYAALVGIDWADTKHDCC